MVLNRAKHQFLISVSYELSIATTGILIFFSISIVKTCFSPLSAKITKWSNTLKQFVGNLPANCLSVFDHFVGLALNELKQHSDYSALS